MIRLAQAIDFTVDHPAVGECRVALFRTEDDPARWQAEIDLPGGRSFATQFSGEPTLDDLMWEVTNHLPPNQ